MDFVNQAGIAFSIFKLVFDYRGKIYDILSKNRIGIAIMTPILLPYGLHIMLKAMTSPFFIHWMREQREQKKITDYF